MESLINIVTEMAKDDDKREAVCKAMHESNSCNTYCVECDFCNKMTVTTLRNHLVNKLGVQYASK